MKRSPQIGGNIGLYYACFKLPKLGWNVMPTSRNARGIDSYDTYQHLMDQWDESIQDDCYLIAADGWLKGAQPREIVRVKNKDNNLSWPEPHD